MSAFVQALKAGAEAYAAAEAANASPLQAMEQTALNAVNAPAQSLLGRPIIGDGTNGGVGENGGPGGILFGNGGNGGPGGPGMCPRHWGQRRAARQWWTGREGRDQPNRRYRR